MDKLRYIMVNLFICLILVSLSHSEIHRAKINTKNNGKRSDSTYVANSIDTGTDEPMNSGYNNNLSSKMERIEVGSMSEVWVYSICGSMLVGLSGIFPLLVIPIEAGPSLKHGVAASRLKLLLSFAVGGLLGDVFLHLLPEAWAHVKPDADFHEAHTRIGLWVILGMLSFLIIEKMFAKEDEFEHLEDECSEAQAEDDELRCRQIKEVASTSNKEQNNGVTKNTRQRNSKNEKKKKNSAQTNTTPTVKNNGILKEKSKESKNTPSIKISGYLNLAANVIDNFTHGLAVAGGFLVSNKVGFITTLAILLHEIPHEVGDFAILLRSGFDRWKAAKAQLLTATGGFIGALTALLADSAQAAGEKTVWVLPFTSGGFLYIALVTVVPDLLEEKHPRESTKQIVCLLAGIAVMYLVCLVH